MMIRLKLSASVRLIPSFFATSPQKSSCLDNGEMTRTVIGGAFFSGAGFKTDPISERRERDEGGVWVFGRRRTKGEIGSDEAVAVVVVVNERLFFLRER